MTLSAAAGLGHIRTFIKVLKDFYAKAADATALVSVKKDLSKQEPPQAFDEGEFKGQQAESGGVIGMLEVIESDFTKSLADGSAAEAMAVEAYEKLTMDNKIATTEKSTAVEYKTKDKKETEEMLVGLKEDKETTEKEYAAVMESAHSFRRPLRSDL